MNVWNSGRTYFVIISRNQSIAFQIYIEFFPKFIILCKNKQLTTNLLTKILGNIAPKSQRAGPVSWKSKIKISCTYFVIISHNLSILFEIYVAFFFKFIILYKNNNNLHQIY